MMSHFCLKHLSGFLLFWDQTPVLHYGPLSSTWPDLCSSDFISALLVLPMGSAPSKPLIFFILFPCPGILPTTPCSPRYSLQTSRKTCLYSFCLLSCPEHPHLCHTNPFPLWSFSRGQVCMYSWGYLLIASLPTQAMTCLLRNLYADQEATVRTGHGTTDWIQIGKEYAKAVYCHPAYLTYMQSTSWETLGWRKHKLESRLLG